MPFYRAIAPGTRDGKRALRRLLALRHQLDDEIPRRTLDETLLIATWNLREFDTPKYGGRLDESILYIAVSTDLPSQRGGIDTCYSLRRAGLELVLLQKAPEISTPSSKRTT